MCSMDVPPVVRGGKTLNSLACKAIVARGGGISTLVARVLNARFSLFGGKPWPS